MNGSQLHPVLPLTIEEVDYCMLVLEGVDLGNIPQEAVGDRFADYLGVEKADELLDFVRAHGDES